MNRRDAGVRQGSAGWAFAILAAAVAGLAPTVHAESGIVVASVTGVSRIEPVLAIDAGRRQGVAMGDRVAILDAGNEAKVVAAGEVFVLDDSKAAVRVTEAPPATLKGRRAVVVPASFVARAKHDMPAGTTIAASAAAVGPGHRQLWIDAGRLSGLTEGDGVWIRRDDFPIARGRLAVVLERTALVQPRPLVTNAVPDVDDLVELWPSPCSRRTGRPESVVMEVTPDKEGAILKLAGARRDGLTPERQLEMFDGGEYVGLAGVLTSSDRLCLAKALRAHCTTQPTVGLRAVGRFPGTRQDARLEARIFEIRDGYALISAGGADGVQAGQTFAVLRDGKTAARLEVKTVEVDFAGADVVPSEPGEPVPELRRWDRVVREPVPFDPVEDLGSVLATGRTGEWLTGAVTGDPDGVREGIVLRVAAEPPVAAIVAAVAGSRALLYVPPGWGRVTVSPGQKIEQVSD